MILHKAVSLARGAVVVLSVGLPLALIVRRPPWTSWR